MPARRSSNEYGALPGWGIRLRSLRLACGLFGSCSAISLLHAFRPRRAPEFLSLIHISEPTRR
eukprot:4167683-Lingulodinium_polyedra.AAC.1